MKYLNKFNSKITLSLLVGTFCLLLDFPVWAEIFDQVVARVNNEIITRSDLEERAAMEISRMQASGQTDMPNFDEMKSMMLDRIIQEKLIIFDGKRIGLNIDEKKVEAALDEIRNRNNLQEGDLEKMLEKEGRSIEDYKENIRNQILLSRVIGLQVKGRIKVSDDELKKYYHEHQKEYWNPPKINVRHILFILEETLPEKDVKTKEQKAQEVMRKLKSGEKFETMAQLYSEDVSAQNGGDLGILERGKMIPEFENAAFALKEGEISEIIRSPYGIHIIKVDKIIPGQTTPIEEVRDKITNTLSMEKFQDQYQEYIEEIKTKAFIEKNWKIKEDKEITLAKNSPRKSKSTPDKKVDILPPLTIKKPLSNKPLPSVDINNHQSVEVQLRHYKQLRETKKISEAEYQKKKQEILENL